MVIHMSDNSKLSQKTFKIDTWRTVIYSLGHGRKHMLAIHPTIWRPGFKVGSHDPVFEANYSKSKRLVTPIAFSVS